MTHPVTINGIILNMLGHHGVSIEHAMPLLSEIKRIHVDDPNVNSQAWKTRSEASHPPLSENDAGFHLARQRIRQLEKAIENAAAGRPHGIKRKKWRHQEADARSIMQVLGHILSRPNPVTVEEMVKDAELLLIRTGERGKLALGELPPMPQPDLAAIIINPDSTNIRLTTTATQDYGIKIESQYGHRDRTKIVIQLKTDLPFSIKEAIQSRIDSALRGRGLGGCNLDDPILKGIEAQNFIDWKGLRGPMRAWLVKIAANENGFVDYKLDMTLEVENSQIEG